MLITIINFVINDMFAMSRIEPEYLIYLWLIVGVVFLFIELGSPGLFFALAFAAGSVCAALSSLITPSLTIQCIIFLISSVISFIIMKKIFVGKVLHEVRTNVHALVGKHALVTKVIALQSPGRVMVEGEEWTARIEDPVTVSPGSKVIIVKTQGNHVIVKTLL